MSNDSLIKHLEKTALDVTKRALALGECGPVGGENERFVRNWVAEREAALAADASSRAEARENEALRIAREANSISRSARNWAIVATVLSAVAVVASVALALWWPAP